jgi:RNA polymerase sigma factor (sigma-70 family)
MPRTINLELPRLRAYIGRALWRNGYQKHEQKPLVGKIIETLRNVEEERSDVDLLLRIEERLARRDGSFKSTDDHVLLRTAIDSVIESRIRRDRNKDHILGERDGLIESRDALPSEHLAIEEIRRQVREKVDQLPEDQQQLIKAVYWDGMTQSDYARQIGKDRRRVCESESRAKRTLEVLLKDVWPLYVE